MTENGNQLQELAEAFRAKHKPERTIVSLQRSRVPLQKHTSLSSARPIAYNKDYTPRENEIMHPTLKSLKITKLFGYKNIELEFNPVTVIVGKNGLGKTTVLKILNALLKQEHCDELDLCDSAELTFSNEGKIKYDYGLSNYISTEFTINEIIEDIFSKKNENSLFNEVGISKEEFFDSIAYKIVNSYLYKEKKSKALELNQRAPGLITSAGIIVSDEITGFITKDAKVSYISTINMSANSQQNIIGSDGKERNFLDFEIENETKELEKTPTGKFTNSFIKEMNKMYLDNQKRIKLDSKFYVEETKGSKRQLKLQNLSSGERQLMYILAKVANTRHAPTFLLMDEPEISLHLHWQENILDCIKSINPYCQIVVVTHSPAIIMNGYMDAYVEMKDITTDGESA